MSESEQWRPWPRDPSISVSNLGRIKGPSGKLLAVRDGKINTKRATKNTKVMIREDAEKMRRLIKYVQETREHRPKRPRPVTPGLPGLHH